MALNVMNDKCLAMTRGSPKYLTCCHSITIIESVLFCLSFFVWFVWFLLCIDHQPEVPCLFYMPFYLPLNTHYLLSVYCLPQHSEGSAIVVAIGNDRKHGQRALCDGTECSLVGSVRCGIWSVIGSCC